MLPAWVFLIPIYVAAFPDLISQAEDRERFAIEMILNDEGFFEEDTILDLTTESVQRIYKFAYLGAKVAAWQSIFSQCSDWQAYLMDELYKPGGICDSTNEYAGKSIPLRMAGR
ncbi:MAG: hypothetical protein PHW04_09410 [Candidatus Wallbacteria bacterium]|nr:hypothetical protein [Candidatus Wallbacteria bacterium]